ncbi:hypothetical protein [Hymenobacter latericus]|uniref:hypothetical protein n=1 Tax=Hymenobacter sp. YIM 151858-1 TaxID=2987688 RepID=UPI0022270988|nr:hypothetical protein [Hymenobacter sp. YIM 151858-1]UYZ61200.1 hypothetical protein OIS50_19720 [Hymenobacter sp. YIM 151858-1]
MQIAYFSHSYRPIDTYVVDHFAKLMRSAGVTPSLDPPSDKVNAAKLERHLNASDGMVAVLTVRDGGVSAHILYEISLCLRARKPLLVFVEDCLPNHLVPQRILQYRFSRTSLLRQVREHRHAFQILKQYIGAEPPPRYQPSALRQTCMLIGASALTPNDLSTTCHHLNISGYELAVLAQAPEQLKEGDLHEAIANANLAIHIVDDLSPTVNYVAGIARATLVPTISLTCEPAYSYDSTVPREYQPKFVAADQHLALESVLLEELRIFSQDFLDLDDQAEVAKYADLLLEYGAPQRRREPGVRNYIIDTVNMNDQYNVNQAGAVGPNAQVHNSTFNQVTSGVNDNVDVQQLAKELTALREALSRHATEPDQYIELGTVAAAEKAAAAGDSNQALQYLKNAGAWVWDTATKVGIGIAIQAAKTSLGI